MASVFEGGPVGGFPFFIAGVSLLSACFVAFCTACKRKDESKLSSLVDDQVSCDEPAVPGPMAPLAFGGSLPSLQHGSERDPGDANIAPALLTLPHPSNEGDNAVGSCSFLILPQRDLPNVPSSPDMTYSNLSFPKRGEVTLCESQRVEGEESRDVHPVADKIVEDVPGHHAQPGGPSYACVVKKKTTADGKQTWVEVDKPPQMSLLTGTGLSLPTKEIEEMYSVVCKDKKKKKAQRPEGDGEEAAPQAKGNPGHCQEIMVSLESNGIASYQPSSLPTAMEPYYDTVPCEPWTKVANQPVAEPAYESVDTYWNKVKKKSKVQKKKMTPENLYESIDQVAI
ncbi:uncharacterized protein LOC116509153 isoform X2 [Thamnophis elegans]|uniref:uncharacterized protein LOC116509153 isoform X2 n=1 Tax=Thamnophis elegans TaxID=35005 RepID=UPI001377FC42|nr:uncharacterized protein LOC116509153 isoform X2 [Thamnophis elegans]